MDAAFPILIVILAGGCTIAAAWPIVWLPRFRPLLAGVSGSTLVAGGIAGFALVLSGCVARAEPGSSLLAASDPAPSSAPDSGSSADQATPATGESGASPSESAADDPIIEAAPDEPFIPPGRPEWVGTKLDETGTIHTVAVTSGPYKRPADAAKALDAALMKATNEYIARQLDSDLAPQLLRYDVDAIRQRFVQPEDTYEDIAIYPDPVGPMHESFVLLQFGPDFRQELERRWASITATSRLGQVGLFAGGVLLLLGTVFSYFRLDNATRGYYTGRLQFLSAAAILTIVGAGALLARWIVWL